MINGAGVKRESEMMQRCNSDAWRKKERKRKKSGRGSKLMRYTRWTLLGNFLCLFFIRGLRLPSSCFREKRGWWSGDCSALRGGCVGESRKPSQRRGLAEASCRTRRWGEIGRNRARELELGRRREPGFDKRVVREQGQTWTRPVYQSELSVKRTRRSVVENFMVEIVY